MAEEFTGSDLENNPGVQVECAKISEQLERFEDMAKVTWLLM